MLPEWFRPALSTSVSPLIRIIFSSSSCDVKISVRSSKITTVCSKCEQMVFGRPSGWSIHRVSCTTFFVPRLIIGSIAITIPAVTAFAPLDHSWELPDLHAGSCLHRDPPVPNHAVTETFDVGLNGVTHITNSGCPVWLARFRETMTCRFFPTSPAPSRLVTLPVGYV